MSTPAADLVPPPRAPAAPRWSPLAWMAGAAFAVLVAAALFIAAAAVAAIGLIVAAAAVVLRAAPRKRAPGAVLEGRRTAEGWVVEAAAPR
ncbi:MAG: hypothetical protein NW200_03135 [Hyphomonadaceae bacterium]|nr:hypothetical protein [Hyphomonadaceae bacterium]